MTDNSFLLYGANGYTGELITRYAAEYNLQPILAGRREEVIKALAAKFNYPYIVFDLDDTTALTAALKRVKVVINAAGPFQFTARQTIESCMNTGTHYLDINGDIAVFEFIKDYDTMAKKAGIMLLPGAGFDVVPTDCIALSLRKMLPDATSLQLAFATVGGGLSHGTATTMVNKLGTGGAVRRDGCITHVPLGHKGMWVDFGVKRLFVMTIPWGDIATAYFTTGIPNIESYTAISPMVYRMLKVQGLFNWLLRTKFLHRMIKRKIDKRPAGPTDEERRKSISLVWGKVTNSHGKTATIRLSGPDGYTLTAHTTLLIVKNVLLGNFKPGYQTPAIAYTEDLILEVPNVKREIIA
jgi:short subunit dehydrogenase-like uncharacterized protein